MALVDESLKAGWKDQKSRAACGSIAAPTVPLIRVLWPCLVVLVVCLQVLRWFRISGSSSSCSIMSSASQEVVIPNHVKCSKLVALVYFSDVGWIRHRGLRAFCQQLFVVYARIDAGSLAKKIDLTVSTSLHMLLIT